ncbi:uncharacterized protein LOC142228729 [Haematobia irritans]|uniref:uncharacterized protein LOC142228729 n=1 Tax=Haematobia irritans TaxID=7368 RepID=UPI003F4FC006
MENMREIVKTLPDYEDDVPMSDEEKEILENNVAPVLREPLPAIEQVPDVGMTPVVASSQGVVPTQKVVPPSGADTAPADVSATNVAKPSSSPTGTAQKNSGVNKRGHSNVCVLCMRSHNLRSCRKFLNMRLEQRLRTVVLHRVCSNCLGRSHMRSTCNSRERCRECGDSHHTLLHSFDQQQRPSAQTLSKRKSKSSSSVNSSAYCITNTAPLSDPMLVLQPIVTLGPTIVLLLVLSDRRIPVRAVLDPCAGYSMICSSLALSLRLVSAMTSQDAFCPLVAVSRHNAESKLVFFCPGNRPDPCCHPIVVGSRYDTGTFRVSPAGRPKVLPSFRGGVGSRARCLRTGSKDTNIFESWIPIGAANDVWLDSVRSMPTISVVGHPGQ